MTRIHSNQRLAITLVTIAIPLAAALSCGGKGSTNPPPVQQPPAAPSSVQVVATSATTAHITWLDNSGTEDGFSVYRGSSSGDHATLVAQEAVNAQAHDDAGLTPGATYWYCVHAFNGYGQSASHAGASVTLPSNGPTIALNPTAQTFAATAGGSSPAARTVAVTNGGTGTLSGLSIGTISYGAGATGWLAASVSPTTAPATITLTATLGSRAAGSYTATVPVLSSAAGVTNSPQNISVTFTVSAAASAPAIALNPASQTFTATAGGSSPAAKTVAVTNGGTGTLSGLAIGTISYGAGASGWLAAGVSPTTAPATVTLTPTLGSLAAGTYTATVPVTSSAAGVTNSPQNVGVTFTVSAPALRPGPTFNVPTVSGTTITLTWSYGWPVLGSSNDGYRLEESTTGATSGFTQIGSYTTRTTPYSVNLTRAAGTYWYRVRVSDAQGWTDYSLVRSATVTVAAPKFTVVNNMPTTLNIHDVVQVKIGAQGVAFGNADLLTNDAQSNCLSLPGESIGSGQSRTFDQTFGANYAIYLGIGTWDLDNVTCSTYSPFFKRTWFTTTDFKTHYVYTIVNISGHTSDTVTFTISGSYLNSTLKVVVTYGGNVIGTYNFTVTP